MLTNQALEEKFCKLADIVGTLAQQQTSLQATIGALADVMRTSMAAASPAGDAAAPNQTAAPAQAALPVLPPEEVLAKASEKGLTAALLAQEERRAEAAETKRADAKELPEELVKLAVKEQRKFHKALEQRQRAVQREQQSIADSEFFTDGARLGQYPPGTRPWKSNASATELDEKLNATITGEKGVVIMFSEGCTLREAQAQAHWQYMRIQKMIERERGV